MATPAGRTFRPISTSSCRACSTFSRSEALAITFFIVGQDAARSENRGRACRRSSDAGHEVGNHSFHHEPWLHLYEPAGTRARAGIGRGGDRGGDRAAATGFRGPGFSLSAATLRVLQTPRLPLRRLDLPDLPRPARPRLLLLDGEAQCRAAGGADGAVRRFTGRASPAGAYRWRPPRGPLLEMPVTTMPVSRLPFHVSYLLYLARFSPAAGPRLLPPGAAGLPRGRGAAVVAAAPARLPRPRRSRTLSPSSPA